MKKIIIISIYLFSGFLFTCYSQNALDAAKSSIKNGEKVKERECYTKKIKCLRKNGTIVGSSKVGYQSNAINSINWYKLKELYFAGVYFKQNLNTEYIYGGWRLTSDQFKLLKNSFEKSNSKGEFFMKYINSSKITCDYYALRYDYTYGMNGDCF
jgi:hypothetical protein